MRQEAEPDRPTEASQRSYRREVLLHPKVGQPHLSPSRSYPKFDLVPFSTMLCYVLSKGIESVETVLYRLHQKQMAPQFSR